MTPLWYRLAWALALPVARLLTLTGGKAARTARGRLGAVAALRRWASASRDTRRTLVWFHAASVGEGRQAEAAIAAVRRRRPGWQVAFTFSSASAERFATALPVDVAAYLPPDTSEAVGRALDALAPSALIFSATDVWPELVSQARARTVPTGLISATLAPTSSRRGPLATALLRGAYAALDRVGAIDTADAAGLIALGAAPDRVSVTGDTRHDSAAQRAARPLDPALRAALESDAPVIVAGSTWRGDERVVLPALATARRAHPGVRLVIAPHEPREPILAALERAAARAFAPGTLIRRLSAIERATGDGAGRGAAAAWDVCVVDHLGVLADIYAVAGIAWVGGGFHAAGLHSVIEPAAHGVPVLFGPRWHGSRDARLLLDAGAAHSVDDAPELAATLGRWLDNETARAAAGAAARAVIQQNLGADERSAGLVIELVERASASI